MLNGQLDNYTISVYTLIENKFDFGLDDYEIFDESYRPILNNAILNYYMFHEIGFINPSIFRHFLKQKMDLIMRNVFNKLYKQRLVEFNPLYNLDSTETYKRDVENEGTSNSNNTSNSTTVSTSSSTNNDETETTTDNNNTSTNSALALNSAYPSQEMKEGEWENGIYVNNGQKQTNNNTSTDKTNSNSSSNGTSEIESNDTRNSTNVGKVENTNNLVENYTKTLKGSSAMLTPSRAMMEFEKYVKAYNLDQQVIDSLSDLFINIY